MSTSNDLRPEPGRKSLLAMLAGYAALALAVVIASRVAVVFHLGEHRPAMQRNNFEAPRPDPAFLAFLGPLALGAPFGSWHVVHVDPTRDGGVRVQVANDRGVRHTIEVHARSTDAPPPPAESSRLALYLQTEHHGQQTTEDAQQACAAFAAALREREQTGHMPPPLAALAASTSDRDTH